MWDQSLRELFERGGPVMWPLLAASIIGLALILDRVLVFAWSYQSFSRLVRRLQAPVSGNEWEQAERLCGRRGPLGQLALVYLQQRDKPEAMRQDILQREGKLLLGGLEKRVRWLAVVGQLSPMLGLLGTVTGLVSAFHQVEQLGGQVQPSDLASGIWEALLTTVFGLVIAIPCMTAYHALEGRVQATSERMSLLVSYLDQWRQESMKTGEGSGEQPMRDGQLQRGRT